MNLLSNPAVSLGIGLLSQPNLGGGLLSGLNLARQGQMMDSQLSSEEQERQIRKQQIEQIKRRQESLQQLRGLLDTGNAPNAYGPPTGPEVQQRGLLGSMAELAPDQVVQSLLATKENKLYALSPGQRLVSQFGDVVAEGGADPNVGKERFDQEGKLRGEYTQVTKTFDEINDAYGRIKASATSPSAAGDLSLIYNYIKMLDPMGAVREQDFAAAASAGSYGERIQGLVSRALNGERLSPEIRKDFVDRSGALYREASEGYKKRTAEFDRLARQNQLDPSNVIFNRQLYEAPGLLTQPGMRPPLSSFER